MLYVDIINLLFKNNNRLIKNEFTHVDRISLCQIHKDLQLGLSTLVSIV